MTCRLFQKEDLWYYCNADLDYIEAEGGGFETKSETLAAAYYYGYGYQYYRIGRSRPRPIPSPHIYRLA